MTLPLRPKTELPHQGELALSSSTQSDFPRVGDQLHVGRYACTISGYHANEIEYLSNTDERAVGKILLEQIEPAEIGQAAKTEALAYWTLKAGVQVQAFAPSIAEEKKTASKKTKKPSSSAMQKFEVAVFFRGSTTTVSTVAPNEKKARSNGIYQAAKKIDITPYILFSALRDHPDAVKITKG